MKTLEAFLIFISIINFSLCANILGVLTYRSPSHWLFFEAVMDSLIEGGHNVTVIGSHQKTDPPPNYQHIDVSEYTSNTSAPSFEVYSEAYSNIFRSIPFIANLNLEACDSAFQSPEVKKIAQSKGQFDLLVTEIYGADCDIVFSHLLDIPVISVVSSTSLPWANDRVATPFDPFYMNRFATIDIDRWMVLSADLSWFQKFSNSLRYSAISWLHWYYNSKSTAIYRKHFGDNIPPVENIIRKTSLVFANSHLAVEGARVLAHNMVNIGGIHIQKVKPLPQELQSILDESPNGFIYFSLGNQMIGENLSKNTLEKLKAVFNRLPFAVLWKFESKMKNVPQNVILREWFPQNDVLNHPNLKLFITHCGSLSTMEGVNAGVPMLAFPLFYDQKMNAANLLKRKSALSLDISSATEEDIFVAIQKLILDDRFREHADDLSIKFTATPVPLKEIVRYQTRRVINTQGINLYGFYYFEYSCWWPWIVLISLLIPLFYAFKFIRITIRLLRSFVNAFWNFLSFYLN